MQFSSWHPITYQLSIFAHRIIRWVSLLGKPLARDFSKNDLPIRVTRHKSVLLRKLGSVDMRLQHNKITNLRLAADRIDGIIIKPGETFSFWKIVGNPSRRRGYVSGMLLSNGRATEGIGGGLCQMANLVYWMALHSQLEVVERHHHSLDIFPDSGRIVPFGTGAAVFYNYIDLQLYNSSSETFQIRVQVTDEHLKGEIRSLNEPELSFSIVERDHRFVQEHVDVYRENAIYRQSFNKQTGVMVHDDLLYKNHSKVLYPVSSEQITSSI